MGIMWRRIAAGLHESADGAWIIKRSLKQEKRWIVIHDGAIYEETHLLREAKEYAEVMDYKERRLSPWA